MPFSALQPSLNFEFIIDLGDVYQLGKCCVLRPVFSVECRLSFHLSLARFSAIAVSKEQALSI